MSPRRRIFLLVIIMFIIAAAVETITIALLYRTGLEEQKVRLVETAESEPL